MKEHPTMALVAKEPPDPRAFEHSITLDPSAIKPPISAIVCAGMRGAETAALQVADAARLRVGGWSFTPEQYAPQPAPPVGHKLTPGNRWTDAIAHNVRDSDATWVFTFSNPNGPTRRAIRIAVNRGKPYLQITLRPRGAVSSDSISRMRAWLVKHDVNVLHVTGSRHETDPGIEGAVVDVLVAILEAA
jgi:hypothetical protein